MLFLIGMMCDLIIGRIAQATGLRQDNGRAANCTVMLLSLRELQAQCKLRVAREGTHRAIRSSVDRGTVWLIQLITAERCQRCVPSGAIRCTGTARSRQAVIAVVERVATDANFGSRAHRSGRQVSSLDAILPCSVRSASTTRTAD